MTTYRFCLTDSCDLYLIANSRFESVTWTMKVNTGLYVGTLFVCVDSEQHGNTLRV